MQVSQLNLLNAKFFTVEHAFRKRRHVRARVRGPRQLPFLVRFDDGLDQEHRGTHGRMLGFG